jgi:multidrug transporter EmrE-like cation transporter
VGLVVLATIVGSFGPLFLKKGSGRASFNLFDQFRNHNLLLGFILYGVSTVIFIPALKGGELSVLYPITSLSYIWVSLISVRWLGERMNWMKWLGVVSIVIGVSIIGFGSG